MRVLVQLHVHLLVFTTIQMQAFKLYAAVVAEPASLYILHAQYLPTASSMCCILTPPNTQANGSEKRTSCLLKAVSTYSPARILALVPSVRPIMVNTSPGTLLALSTPPLVLDQSSR